MAYFPCAVGTHGSNRFLFGVCKKLRPFIPVARYDCRQGERSLRHLNAHKVVHAQA